MGASIPNAAWPDIDIFMAESEAKRLKFSQRDPELWRDLLAKANPLTLTVCKHLESEEADRACPCRYPGSVWADGEHVLFTMGDQWGDEAALQAPRIGRETEIATAQLLTCLFNNAEWLIGLAASGMSASGQDPQGLEAKPASPTRNAGGAQ